MATLREWMRHLDHYSEIELRSRATNAVLVIHYSDARLNHFYREEIWELYQDEPVVAVRIESCSPKITLWVNTQMTVKPSNEVERIDTS